MTTPAQPPPQRAAETPQTTAVRQAQDEGIALVGPALATFTQAVMTYTRANGRVAGTPFNVAKKIGYDAAMITVLVMLAQRALAHQRAWAVGPRAAEQLWEHTDAAQQAGVNAGLEMLKRSAQHIARAARVDEATGGSPGISLPGEPYDPHAGVHSATYADPQKIVLPLVQTVQHSAQTEAASLAGWQYKIWNDVHDNRVRAAHAFLGSKKYEFHRMEIDKPFVDINGHTLWYPGDTSAPPEAWMNCRCYLSFQRGTNQNALPLAASG